MIQSTKSRLAALAVAAVLATGLAGCAGDDDTPATPAATAQVPASASATASGFIAYLQALVVSPADTLEPVDVSAVTPPQDNTSEPTPIN